jgi:hypothetical protein
MPAFLRAFFASSVRILPASRGSRIGLDSGPLCQPSATANWPLPAWKTRPVISRLSSLTSQVATGAIHFGLRVSLSSSV